MSETALQKEILETLERKGDLSVSRLAEVLEVNVEEVKDSISQLKNRNLVIARDTDNGRKIESQSPIPISTVAYRGELTPTQAIIQHLYEERGYGQTEIARILDYSPGNVQTNINRIEEKLGRKVEK